MLPKPEVGQLVRLENYDERLIITSVSEDGGKVDLVSETDPTHGSVMSPVWIAG